MQPWLKWEFMTMDAEELNHFSKDVRALAAKKNQ